MPEDVLKTVREKNDYLNFDYDKALNKVKAIKENCSKLNIHPTPRVVVATALYIADPLLSKLNAGRIVGKTLDWVDDGVAESSIRTLMKKCKVENKPERFKRIPALKGKSLEEIKDIWKRCTNPRIIRPYFREGDDFYRSCHILEKAFRNKNSVLWIHNNIHKPVFKDAFKECLDLCEIDHTEHAETRMFKAVRSDEYYDPEQLAIGIEIEMEHTDDREIAKKIAKHHLGEFRDYYRELVKMEKKLESTPLPYTPKEDRYWDEQLGGWVKKKKPKYSTRGYYRD